ncbi:MAG: hypothetical protein EHM70_03655 [Chloroflexota bacterium]|nr:MAG: hypothetical protein EHM70_03655 [Chloroflexota bacterium]
MKFYESSSQLYTAMEILFQRLSEQTPSPMDALKTSRLVIRLRLREPEAVITVNGRQNPVKIICGPCSLRPDLDVEMSADTLHQILVEQLSLKQSLADRQLKVLGPVWKTHHLAEILHEGRAIYPKILSDQGLDNG